MSKLKIHVLSLAPLSTRQKERLRTLGELFYTEATLHDSHQADKCRGADIVIATPRLHQDIVAVLDRCKLISVQAIGTDSVDVISATRKGIVICNVSNASLTSVAVAEHAFALLLALAKKLAIGGKLLRSGLWRTGVAYQPVGLAGKTIGVVGFGKIGKRVASIAKGFDLHVLVCTARPEKYREVHPGIQFVQFPALLENSDFVILAVPATQETEGIISSSTLARMKRSAFLVNVGRGRLVVEKDLAEALERGRIAGAATDVFIDEPPSPQHPLLSMENVAVTPHVAGSTEEAIANLLEQSVTNVESFLAGRPVNVVNPEVLRTARGQ